MTPLLTGLLALFRWSLPAIAAEPPPPPPTCPVLMDDLSLALRDYTDARWADFEVHAQAARASLPCQTTPLPSETVVYLHLLQALQADREQDALATQRALRAVLAIRPDFTLGPSIAPPSLQQALADALTLPPTSTQPLPEGRWAVDGRIDAVEHPTQQAALVQRLEPLPPSGWYLSGMETPPYPWTRPDPPLDPRRSRWIALSAGGTSTLAIFAGAWAASTHQRYPQATSAQEADALQRQNHIAVLTGSSLGILGGGLLTTAIVIGEW